MYFTKKWESSNSCKTHKHATNNVFFLCRIDSQQILSQRQLFVTMECNGKILDNTDRNERQNKTEKPNISVPASGYEHIEHSENNSKIQDHIE